MSKKILITGANGQLGSEIKELQNDFNHTYTFIDIADLDFTNTADTEIFFKQNQFDYIVNCAAYTAVDKAEEEKELAVLINAELPGKIAAIAAAQNAKLIHISTDYVFNGENYKPYKENNPTTPNSSYGNTKLKGEENVLSVNHPAIIIRTSWLYSSFGNNFVKTMIRLGKERNELGVVFDQVGTPTYAADLALSILKIIDSDINNDSISKSEIYHFSNEGVCSWYDFALEIFRQENISCKVNPIESWQFPTPAKRPFYSVLNKGKIKNDFKLTIPHWTESLSVCLNKLKS